MQEITKSKDRSPKTKNQIVWYFFAFSIVAVYFFALGGFPLVGPDEARYAQIAREMLQRKDWITPTLGGFDWFEKPALLYWLQIIFYKIFGVSEFSARFGSAVFGLGTIFSLYLLGKFAAETYERGEKKAKDENQRTKENFADWLAVIAASSIGLLVFSRGASFDIILTFPLTASLAAFFIFDQSKNKTSALCYPPLAAFYFFIGVALLAKGLIGVVFPFAIVAFYFVLSRRLPDKIFVFSLIWGTLLSFLIAAVWYLPMYLTNGWKFVDEFFIQHHFQRFASDKYRHWQPFWFFWLVLPLMTIPWLPFFAASIWNLLKVQSSKFKAQSSKFKAQSKKDFPRLFPISLSPLLLFSLSWLLVPLVFFSFSGSKLPGYILPALPAALILTTEYVCEFVRSRPRRKRALQFLAFFTFIVIVLLLQFVAPNYAARNSVKNLIAAADAKGFEDKKIVNLYVVNHNAEFYAAGRLVRDEDGKLKRYDDFSNLVKDLKRENLREILAFVPVHAVRDATESSLAEADILSENGETALVLIKLRD